MRKLSRRRKLGKVTVVIEPKRIQPSWHIHLLVDKNPKTKGTLSYVRFNKYRDSMTVKEYEAACQRLKYPRAHADLLWDQSHGYIRLNGTKGH